MPLLYLVFVSILTLEANSIWWQSNFDEAHHEAVKSSKKLMVLLIEKDSQNNQKTFIETFMNKEYIDKINEEFISVIVTKNQDASYPIELLYTTEYPSVFFLDNLEIFLCEPLRGRGNVTPEKFREHLLECK